MKNMFSNMQFNPNLCWNRQTGIPVLYSVQALEMLPSGRGGPFLSHSRASAVPTGLLRVRPPLEVNTEKAALTM